MQTMKTLGLEEAKAAGDAMINKAIADKERPIAVAICGKGGELIYYVRMDGTPAIVERMAINKAYTAAFWGRKTEDLMENMKKRERQLEWYGGDPQRETIIPGGAPIKTSDGTVVGGIGVSGKLGDDPKDTVKDYHLVETGLEALKSLL